LSNDQLVYWKAINELLTGRLYEKNCLVLEILCNQKMSLEDFFNLPAIDMKAIFKLSDTVIESIQGIIAQIPSLAFEVESLYKQGIEMIALNDQAYPGNIKKLLKKHAPMLLYVKGDKALLNEKIAAVVGSRDVSEKGILFTRNVTGKCVGNSFVISSGYARGVDKIALETALENDGKSIAVIPQGILTFKSDLKKLYARIIEGRVLVMSAFPPNAPWTVGRAMERNKYIYGLAERIYVAETGSNGGTWSGAVEGLKAKQDIFVRCAEQGEKCANNKLIALGAVPVDMNGETISNMNIPLEGEAQLEARLPEILKTLENTEMSTKQVIETFGLVNITSNLLAQKLKQMPSISVATKNQRLVFGIKKDGVYEQMSFM